MSGGTGPPPARVVRAGEVLALDAPPLRLAFRKLAASWAHDLSVGGRTWAVSVEFDPDRDDPSAAASPVYQETGPDEGPGAGRLLLIGRWGPCHGSAVFSAGRDGSAVVIAADVAVRSRSPLSSLAATYTVALTSGDLIDAGPAGVEWSVPGDPPGRLRFEPGDSPSHVALAEAGRAATRVQALAGLKPGEATQRLTYRWRWVPS